VLTNATRCPVNLLHLSSAEPVASGARGRRDNPHLDIRLETTVHHLALTHETAGGIIGKVKPPDQDRGAPGSSLASGVRRLDRHDRE
jgi:dihydroorotase-like cyclic amidohydrolase